MSKVCIFMCLLGYFYIWNWELRDVNSEWKKQTKLNCEIKTHNYIYILQFWKNKWDKKLQLLYFFLIPWWNRASILPVYSTGRIKSTSRHNLACILVDFTFVNLTCNSAHPLVFYFFSKFHRAPWIFMRTEIVLEYISK